MAGKLLPRKGQVAFEVESVEGTAETLVAADATMLAYDPTCDPDIQRFTRNPARSTLSQLDAVIGKQPGRMSWRTEFKGSGAVGTAPAWADAIRCCGWAESAVSSIAIGSVTSGPFIPGETVTGGTSGATGRVVGECRDGDTNLFFVPLTGTWQSAETVTGGTSSASATTSGTETTDQGFEYRPASSSVPSGTAALYMDGTRKLIYGARGNVRAEMRGGEPAFLAFDFQGVWGGASDTALLSPTYESTIPIAFLNVQCDLHGLAAIFNELSIDMQNEIAERTSANATKGILSYLITGRNPVGSIDPEMELVADHDFYGRLEAGTTGRVYVELPSTSSGEKITVAGVRTQYGSIGSEERSGIAVARIGLEFKTSGVSAGDDELQIGMITGG